MSQLEWKWAYFPYLDAPEKQHESAVNAGYVKVVLKSEADKVIAELKQKLNEAQTELELWRDGYIISEAHQKELDEKHYSDYKRCMAMAKWCRECSWSKCVEKVDFYYKWYNRWLEIAEKFKPKK